MLGAPKQFPKDRLRKPGVGFWCLRDIPSHNVSDIQQHLNYINNLYLNSWVILDLPHTKIYI